MSSTQLITDKKKKWKPEEKKVVTVINTRSSRKKILFHGRKHLTLFFFLSLSQRKIKKSNVFSF